MNGIRVEVQIHSPGCCPVVDAATSVKQQVTSVSWAGDESGTVTEEFVVDSDTSVPSGALTESRPEFEEIFAYNSRTAFRFERHDGEKCPCEHVEAAGCPLIDVRARDDALVLLFHTPDIEQLQQLVGELQEHWSDVSVHRLIQSTDEQSADELVFVDRSTLTDRQVEVLETAHEMGYFEHPKGANASEVADALDITQATFSEHLAAAQRKLLTNILEA